MLAPSNCVKLIVIGEKPTSWESCRRPPNTRPDITHQHTSQLPRFYQSHTSTRRFTRHSLSLSLFSPLPLSKTASLHTCVQFLLPLAFQFTRCRRQHFRPRSTLTYSNHILRQSVCVCVCVRARARAWQVNLIWHSFCTLDLRRTVQVSPFWEMSVAKIKLFLMTYTSILLIYIYIYSVCVCARARSSVVCVCLRALSSLVRANNNPTKQLN